MASAGDVCGVASYVESLAAGGHAAKELDERLRLLGAPPEPVELFCRDDHYGLSALLDDA